MNCMRCGREVKSDQVFCQDCLLDMEKYPVKPGTSVQLPRRRETPVSKKAHPRRRSGPSFEEQAKLLKKRLRLVYVLLAVTAALLAALAYPAFVHLMEEDFLPGQNYSAVDSTEPSDAE